MKKLIFIDNDHESEHNQCLKTIKRALRSKSVSESIIDSIKPIYGFHRLNRDEVTQIVFDQENVIMSRSMYTYTHFNSLGQMLSLFKTAGQCDIKNCTYIDFSGLLTTEIERYIDSQSSSNILNLLFSFYENNIITKIESDFYLVKAIIKSRSYQIFTTTQIEIQDYL